MTSQIKPSANSIYLKWAVVGFVLFSFISVLKVLIFEQNSNGTLATSRQCVEIDESCDPDYGPGGTSDCCIRYSDKSEPLGDRIWLMIKIWGTIGVIVGFFYGDYKSKEQDKPLT